MPSSNLSKRVLTCVVLLGVVVLATSTGCKKPPAVGACVVAFDKYGPKGGACAVVEDAECKDDMSPAPMGFASSTKRTSFTAGKSCADVGFTKGGCADVPMLWTFKDRCPG